MELQHTPAEIWQRIASEAQLQIPRPAFETWLRGAEAHGIEGETLRVSFPNDYVLEYVNLRLATMIRHIAVREGIARLEFTSRVSTPKEQPAAAPVVDVPKERTFSDLKRHQLIRWLLGWKFSWPHRLLRDYPQDLIVELLNDMIGSPDSGQAEQIKPAWFVDELKVLVEERQHTADEEAHVGAIVPFDQWHKSA